MSIDPYFLPAYVKVNEIIEGGVAETFRYEGPEGEVSHSFIRREIQQEIFSVPYYDLVSPYGYGGPLLVPSAPGEYASLASAFQNAFSEYCRDQNIVSEFVRFHPFEISASVLEDLYAIQRRRSTVVTDLMGENVLMREFSKNTRKKIRRNNREGVEISIKEFPNSLEEFMRLYTLTMDRNNAGEFYYFDDTYFDSLLRLLKESLLLVEAHHDGKTIASALCLVGAGNIHIHLSGTDPDYLQMSPAYSLRNAIAEWGIERKMKLIHHGGGRTDEPTDALFLYKKQFGSKVADFHTGTKIWNEDAYRELCESRNLSPEESNFFPAYRS